MERLFQARPNSISDGNLPSGARSRTHWFDTTAFVVPNCICFGNSGRDILRGPGFLPGYGLYGLSRGFAEDLQGLTLPDLYLTDTDYDGWPKKLVSICDWGCTMGSAIDCSTPEGEMIFIGAPIECSYRKELRSPDGWRIG